MSHYLREFCAKLKESGIVEEFHRLAHAEKKRADVVPLEEQGIAQRGQQIFRADGSSVVVYFDGQPFVYGVPAQIKPISNAPIGVRLRFRFRQADEGVVFFRTTTGVECWTLDDYGDHWQLGVCRSSNVR